MPCHQPAKAQNGICCVGRGDGGLWRGAAGPACQAEGGSWDVCVVFPFRDSGARRAEAVVLREVTLLLRHRWKSHFYFRPHAFPPLPSPRAWVPSQENHPEGRFQTLSLEAEPGSSGLPALAFKKAQGLCCSPGEWPPGTVVWVWSSGGRELELAAWLSSGLCQLSGKPPFPDTPCLGEAERMA